MIDVVTCHRCGREFDPERADLDGWVVLDAREDGWTLSVCADCETAGEREIARSAREEP